MPTGYNRDASDPGTGKMCIWKCRDSRCGSRMSMDQKLLEANLEEEDVG